MTVAELIKALSALPPDFPVLAWDGDYQHCVDIRLIDAVDGEVCLFTGRKRRLSPEQTEKAMPQPFHLPPATP